MFFDPRQRRAPPIGVEPTAAIADARAREVIELHADAIVQDQQPTQFNRLLIVTHTKADSRLARGEIAGGSEWDEAFGPFFPGCKTNFGSLVEFRSRHLINERGKALARQ